jgi:hypothetical protein
MIALLRLVPLSAWACFALLAALGVQSLRIGALKGDVAELRLALAEGAVQAERVTREAVEQARIEEREQTAKLALQGAAAVAKEREAARLAQRRYDDLNRSIEEASHDPTVDLWLRTAVPESIRLLYGSGDTDGANRSDPISVPTNPPGPAG